MNRPLVIANWKMNGTQASLDTWCARFNATKVASDVRVAVCPPYPLLPELMSKLGSSVLGGSQDVSVWGDGAYTGDVSARLLADIGCCLTLIGHSERRQLMGEGNDFVNQKILQAVSAGILPVLCVGETAEERVAGKVAAVLEHQIKSALQAFFDQNNKPQEIVIAYEPVWAIGSGKSAEISDISVAHKLIKNCVATENPEFQGKITVLYGGSVKLGNAASLANVPEVDGVLIGGASLDPEVFAAICNCFSLGSDK